MAFAEKKVDCLLYTIENAWDKRDAGNVPIIHTTIVELLVIAPEETLKWLSRKEGIAKELLAKWQYKVFTDYTGTKDKELNNLKLQLINSLEKSTIEDETTKALKKKMLEDLSGMKIRKID